MNTVPKQPSPLLNMNSYNFIYHKFSASRKNKSRVECVSTGKHLLIVNHRENLDKMFISPDVYKLPALVNIRNFRNSLPHIQNFNKKKKKHQEKRRKSWLFSIFSSFLIVLNSFKGNPVSKATFKVVGCNFSEFGQCKRLSFCEELMSLSLGFMLFLPVAWHSGPAFE